MMKINKELKALIAKSLPEATANEMKEFISEAQQTKKDLDDANKKIAKIEEVAIANLAEIGRLKKFEADSAEVERVSEDQKQNALALEESERNINIQLLEVKLECANSSNNQILQLVDKVFGHPSVMVTNTKGHIMPQHPDYGFQTVQHETTIDTETTTTEKV